MVVWVVVWVVDCVVDYFVGISGSGLRLIISRTRASNQSNHDPREDQGRKIDAREIEPPMIAGQVPNTGVVNVKQRMGAEKNCRHGGQGYAELIGARRPNEACAAGEKSATNIANKMGIERPGVRDRGRQFIVPMHRSSQHPERVRDGSDADDEDEP